MRGKLTYVKLVNRSVNTQYRQDISGSKAVKLFISLGQAISFLGFNSKEVLHLCTHVSESPSTGLTKSAQSMQIEEKK